MKIGSKFKSNLLKHTVNSIWYAGLTVGIFLLIAVVVFNFAVVTKWNIKFPTITLRMNEHAYKFNNRYLEIRRLDKITDLYIGKEFFKETLKDFSSPFERKAKESLYNIDFTPIRALNWDTLFLKLSPQSWLDFQFTEQSFTREKVNLLPGLIYYETLIIPPFWIGLSTYIILTIFFLLIILYNTRKISLDALTNSVFTKENAIRIRFIAIYIILAEFVRILIFYWINNSIANMHRFSYLKVDELIGFYGHFDLTWTDINYWLIFVGIILLLISAILQSGSSIKEENDLTV
ncbi:MAG: DUF2975 domain-containing protein [Ignavibacteriales bacterium]|nr:MAG: DUF2975 domain-containing protein [Ignavibacteriales bacterium]